MRSVIGGKVEIKGDGLGGPWVYEVICSAAISLAHPISSCSAYKNLATVTLVLTISKGLGNSFICIV